MSRDYQVSAWSRRQIADNGRLDIDAETHTSCLASLRPSCLADSDDLGFNFPFGKRCI